MIFSSFKNSIFLNLLSISGYIYFVLWLYIYFVIRPDIMDWQGYPGADPELVGMAHAHVYVDIMFSLFTVCFILSSIFILLAIIEVFLRKKDKIPEFKGFDSFLYSFLFKTGIILQLTPICFVFISFLVH